MVSEKDLELLDQYVGNRLNAQDKAAFEQKLEVDTELKNELLLQQRIVGGIRQARSLELKKMLNDIPLSSIPGEGPALVTKISLWVVAGALVSTGLYLYFKQDNTQIQPTLTTEVIKDQPLVKEDGLAATDQDQQQQNDPSASTPEDAPREQNTAPAVPKEVPPAERAVTSENAVELVPLDVFDPSEELSKAGDESSEEKKTNASTTPSIIVETQTDKRYNFHYQFKDNKLYLYGSFEKNLYEIMEFFSDNKRTMFLFYRENYYLLNEENEKVRALTPINDAVLLKKLKDYRGN